MRSGRGAPAGLAPPWWLTALVGVAAGAFVAAISWNRSSLGEPERIWAAMGTVVMSVLVATALPRAQQLMPTPGVVPATILATLAAMYACVPETDQIPPVAIGVGVVIAIEVVTWRRLRLSWHAGAAWIVMWAGIYGATGRQSALVGALFAWWPVIIVPLVADIWRRTANTAEPVRWVIAFIGSLAAVIVARTGGLQPTGGPAVRAVAIWGPASLVVASLLAVAGARWLSARPDARQR